MATLTPDKVTRESAEETNLKAHGGRIARLLAQVSKLGDGYAEYQMERGVWRKLALRPGANGAEQASAPDTGLPAPGVVCPRHIQRPITKEAHMAPLTLEYNSKTPPVSQPSGNQPAEKWAASRLVRRAVSSPVSLDLWLSGPPTTSRDRMQAELADARNSLYRRSLVV